MKNQLFSSALYSDLEEWGDYVMRPVKGLSYPAQSSIYTLMRMHAEEAGIVRGRVIRDEDNKPLGASTFDGAPKQTKAFTHRDPEFRKNKRAARVDKAVRDLPKEWRLVLFARYAEKAKESQAAKFCNMGRRKYYETLNFAHAYLAGWLGHGIG